MTSPPTLRLLLLGEDPEAPARLVRDLTHAFPGVAVLFAGSRPELEAALGAPAFDAVLADTRLRWASVRDIVAALSSRAPDRPFVLLLAPGGADAAAEVLDSSLVGGVVRAGGHGPEMADSLRRVLERAERCRLGDEMHALVSAVEDVMIVLDADGRYLRIAPSAPDLLYRPADSVLGRTLHEVFPQREADFFLEHIRTALRTREPVRFEYGLPIDGQDVRFDASVSPLSETTVLLVARDVTARARAEQVRAATYRVAEAVNGTRDLTELLRTIHGIVGELMPAGNFYIALYDRETETVSFPYSVDERDPPRPPRRLGHGMTEYVLRTGQPALISSSRALDLIRRGEIAQIGAPSVSWLGVPLVVEDRVIGVVAIQSYTEGVEYGQGDSEILRFVGTHIALAIERKRSETALLESEARYRRLVESSPDAIIVHEAGTICYANPAAVAQLGVSGTHELIGRSALDFVHPESRSTVVERMRRMAVDHADEPAAQERFVRPDGTVIDADVTASAITWDGRPAVLVTVRDITERVALEQKLRQSQKMEAVGRLAGGIAHDFNSLLTVIKVRSELLLNELDDGDSRREDVVEVQRAADRAADLTRQLLAYGRRQMLVPELLDLNDVVRGAVTLLERLVGERIRILTQLSPAVGPVRADPTQLNQVLLSLVLNARDAMPDGGTLTLATEDDLLDPASVSVTAEHSILGAGRYVTLTVTDTGVGMDAETRSHLFEPFFTTKDVGKGRGLGLATVYGIVRQSGGYVWVESEPKQGTAVHIALPSVETRAGGGPAASAPARTGGGAETILIAEDDSGVRAAARHVLARLGYRVLEAESGEAALRVAGEHPGPIDLLLTDVVMPGMNGRALAEELTRSRPALRVLYMSGYTENAIVQEGVLLPGLAFVAKPFTPRALREKVRETLDGVPTGRPAANA